MDTQRILHIALKNQATLEVEKLMNKYEFLLSHARLEEVEQLFALDQPDVCMDLSFGFWQGPAGIHRCVIGLHGKLFRGEDGLPAIGCYHLNANTTGIIEVAEDLKTAKGMWCCPGTYNNPSDETESGAISMAGACLRTCDFIYDEASGRTACSPFRSWRSLCPWWRRSCCCKCRGEAPGRGRASRAVHR